MQNNRLTQKDHHHDSCGVGFITNKHSKQTHKILEYAHQALCKVPHRGGMNANGVGDGAGVNIDLSVNFYRELTGKPQLQLGDFGVANFFMPDEQADAEAYQACYQLITQIFAEHDFSLLLERIVPVDNSVLNEYSQRAQQPILQWVFARPEHCADIAEFSHCIREALIALENIAFNDAQYANFYTLSMNARTQVYKGLLNSWEVVPYFKDLCDARHKVSMLFFHTRFSTNTAPNIFFAQPFRRMAHNGELNTDRKNRLSEDAIARVHGKTLIFPPGQSDSARLDQTLTRRIHEDKLSVDRAILQMMPPAWENDPTYPQDVRDMLAYFSLFEEKNDGPAAIVFCDGIKIGARLDRLGLRPLRSVETRDYLAVMSEAGQIHFPPDDVIRRGRIEAGGMILFDHSQGKLLHSEEILADMAKEQDFASLLNQARYRLNHLPEKSLADYQPSYDLSMPARHVAYGLNQESFKFMLDPMLQAGAEKVSAMGYGIAPSGLSGDEGGLFRYFTQRFAQVTNPPLDSLRERDGMTLRVTLGGKPHFKRHDNKQLVLESPILLPQDIVSISQAGEAGQLGVAVIETLYPYEPKKALADYEAALQAALDAVSQQVIDSFKNGKDIVILDDSNIDESHIALPAVLTIASINQRLVEAGLRFDGSLVYATGQACSTHDIAVLLGFGASAVYPVTAYERASVLADKNGDDKPQKIETALKKFKKAVEKSLLKTMGKIGLCTVESYIGGEFFEASFLNTDDLKLRAIFPHIQSPLAGATFSDIVLSSINWHHKMLSVLDDSDDRSIPLLGLFKERQEGAGHTFGNIAVRAYSGMTGEDVMLTKEAQIADNTEEESVPTVVLPPTEDEQLLRAKKFTAEEIDEHRITDGYRAFSKDLATERAFRPAALRDVLAFPVDLTAVDSAEGFKQALSRINRHGNINYAFNGLSAGVAGDYVTLTLSDACQARHQLLADALASRFDGDITQLEASAECLTFVATGAALDFAQKIVTTQPALSLDEVQPATEILPTLVTGAMSHGSLITKTHEAIATAVNMVGGKSNCGEGGEHLSRFDTLKGSKIKQIASGRFGVWTGYLADPMLEEIEIKIAQGAKPGEGGQLPDKKVTVEIAASRGGTPRVELVSPPPHHDTYSIEDLAQLIHDAKAARVRVIVKLVSTEGIGTIAVGVAKAGADVINIAGNTGGTGAAQVTSLKHTGRIAELGIAEVHQALCENGFRDKITLRASNAHQTGSDIVKSAMMGADSFEMGTAALMMLKCVMAKNCNVKCPAGLTTNPEVFDGDPRSLAQYLVNMAHEVREILASLGMKSLSEVRGRTDLLHLIAHKNIVGRLDMSALLYRPQMVTVDKPIYLEKDYHLDEEMFDWLQQAWDGQEPFAPQNLGEYRLSNTHKSFGGQLSIDIERWLNYPTNGSRPEILNSHLVKRLDNGRYVLNDSTVTINTYRSAGQSYGAFNNTGITLIHSGTCNDGVGKSMSGGRIVIKNSGGGDAEASQGNVLIGNFALFGATGGRLFVEGQAGDRFGVRNSGAFAVVEGVGDFACEYMTGGVVINLGSYGKGFGNGMSGGIAFQYDPSGEIAEKCSKDSVICRRFGDTDTADNSGQNGTQNSDFMSAQEQALLRYLKAHRRRTHSPRIRAILDHWDSEKDNFFIVIPKAWYANHCLTVLNEQIDAKSWLEELAGDTAIRTVEALATAYSTQQPLFAGDVPSYDDDNVELSSQLTNTAGIYLRAVQIVAKDSDELTPKQLIINHDQRLVEQLAKDIKLAITGVAEADLVPMIADKRLADFVLTMQQRAVNDSLLESVDIWVNSRRKRIDLALSETGSINRYLSAYYSEEMNKHLVEMDRA